MPELFDVIEVQEKSPHTIRLMAENKTRANAEAIINMAIMRRGVDGQYYDTAPAGRYRDGDKFEG